MINFDFNFDDFESSSSSFVPTPTLPPPEKELLPVEEQHQVNRDSIPLRSTATMYGDNSFQETNCEKCKHTPSSQPSTSALETKESPSKTLEERTYNLPSPFSQYPRLSLCDRITGAITNAFQFIKEMYSKKPKESSDCTTVIPKGRLEEPLEAATSVGEKEDAIDQNAFAEFSYQNMLLEHLRLQQGNLEALSQNAQHQIKTLAPRIFALCLRDYNYDVFRKISFTDKTLEKIMHLFFNVIDLDITGNWNITPKGIQAILKNPLISLNISENPKLNTLTLFSAISTHCCNLVSLNISKISSHPSTVDAVFPQIGQLSRLRTLNCSYNCFLDPQTALDYVRQLSLEELDISGVETFSPRIAQARKDVGFPVFSNETANTWIAHLPTYHPNLHTLKTTVRVEIKSLQHYKNLQTLKCQSILAQENSPILSLTHLDLSFDHHTEAPVEQPQDVLTTIANHFPLLQSLNLSECLLQRDFKPLQRLKHLQELNLNGVYINSEELCSLAPLPSLKKIHLIVYNVQQSAYYPPLFTQLSSKNFPNLETVVLPHCNQDMEGEILAFMKDNPNLKVCFGS